MTLQSDSMHDLYSMACSKVYIYGDDIITRGLKVRELNNVELVLTNPRDRLVNSPARNMSLRYMVGEMCFYLNGSTDLDSIAFYGPFWRRVSDDGVTVRSAYGYRLFNLGQFEYAVKCLLEDPTTRKAVMPIYAPTDAVKSKDNPCTMFLQLMIRNNALNCYVFMRSNDIWLGLPYDAAFFTFLQEMCYNSLLLAMPTLRLGSYFHHATSLHCYDEHIDDIWEVQCEEDVLNEFMPAMTRADLSTWFVQLIEHEIEYRKHKYAVPTLPGMQGWMLKQLR